MASGWEKLDSDVPGTVRQSRSGRAQSSQDTIQKISHTRGDHACAPTDDAKQTIARVPMPPKFCPAHLTSIFVMVVGDEPNLGRHSVNRRRSNRASMCSTTHRTSLNGRTRTGLSIERLGSETQFWAHARNPCPRRDASDLPIRMTATRATGGSYALVFPVPKCAAVPFAAAMRIVAFLFWLAIPQSDGLQRPALRAFASESADAPSRSRARVTLHQGADIC
ncbi:hypothetical protein CMPELA_04165 [Cupriavidus necator]